MLYELGQVTRVHNGRKILDIDGLAIERGRITALIGANGAGKTTLLQILAFLDTPSSGQVSFLGETVEFGGSALLELRRRIVLVDQYPILFTGSVQRNLEFGLKVRGVERAERLHRVTQALDLVGMGEFLHARAEKLSGGETKRIALARALALRPAVLLCDEPTANVDFEHQEVILNTLERANGEENISIVFSTHALEQAERLADTLVTLKGGRLSRLSRVNVWPAIIDDGPVAVIAGRGRREVRLPLAPDSLARSPGRRVNLFFDPEKLRLLPVEEKGDDQRHLPATVMQLTADEQRIKVTVDIGVPIDVYLSAGEYGMRPPRIGEPVLLQVAAGALTVE